jgi:hypothetical protein
MTIEEISNIALLIIGSVGSAGAIVLGLSNWLGKLWADKIMANERHKFESELAELRSKLERANQQALADIRHQQEQSIEGLKSDLDIFKNKHLKGFNDKLICYRELINLIADVLGRFDDYLDTGNQLTPEFLAQVNTQRLKIYGLTAMVAPQSVMDAQDVLVDHIFAVLEGEEPYFWEVVRGHSINLINEIRIDIGIDISPIQYNGKR